MSDAHKEARKKRTTAKQRYHRIYNRMMQGLDDGEDEDVLKQIISDLEMAYKVIEEKNEVLIETIDPPDEQSNSELIEKLEDEMNIMYHELCKARNGIVAIRRKHEERDKKVSAIEKEQKALKEIKVSTIKIKPLQAPIFSGNIREYPSFKKDYESHMTKIYGKDPFALKKCLSDEALRHVLAVDDDYDEMMSRLDFRYGRPEKLVDVILGELKMLKRVEESDNRKFIQMVDLIERSYLDLKKVKLQSEMNTTCMLGLFEKKLPPSKLHEWALKKQLHNVGKPQFDAFLLYLKEQRNAMEYVDEDVRKQTQVKAKVSFVNRDAEEELCEDNPIQKQLEEIVKGLAHVARLVSDPQSQPRYNRMGMKGRCFFHGTDSHEIVDCGEFAALSYPEKMGSVRKSGACFCCLKVGHLSRNCMMRKVCGVTHPESQQVCNRYHHPMLHSSTREGLGYHCTTGVINPQVSNTRRSVLLMIGTVYCNGKPLTVMYDSGANISLISRAAAKNLRLKGMEVTLSLTKVGNVTSVIRSKEYDVPLTDVNGKVWKISVCEMEEVTSNVNNVNWEWLSSLFPEYETADLERPSGRVDLLIGSDCCRIFPSVVSQVDNLQLMRNQFGYCFRGSHERIECEPRKNDIKASLYLVSGSISHIDKVGFGKEDGLKAALDQFYNLDGLGVQFTPQCGGCRCGRCPVGSKSCTIKEERELKMIEDGLSYDEVKKQWTATYPLVRNLEELPNNLSSAIRRLQSLERRLLRTGREYAATYHMQIMDMVSRNVAQKMNDKDHRYEGPVHYIPHHEVIKEESQSTPMRVVFNSSASYLGHRLNDYWAKGPCVLNDMLGVFLRFRENYVAVIGDISKMYNAVKISVADQHVHRFVWRDLDMNKDVDHYILKTVTFGDKPSGTIAVVALKNTAKLMQGTYPAESKIITDNSYVDDILFSVESHKMAIERTKVIENILSQGSFLIKHWIVSGSHKDCSHLEQAQSSNYMLQPPEEKVLGMTWLPEADVFIFKANVNFAKGIKVSHELTRRMLLSQLAKTFDPLGLLIPFILLAKILMRSMCQSSNVDNSKVDWDAPVGEEIKLEWMSFFSGLFEVEKLIFRRCIKAGNASGDPVLILFSDGSKSAFGCCAYIRWQISEETFEAKLIMAKNRIAPSKQLSIPRLELCGAVLSARLREKLVEELDFKFSRIFHLTDSMIVRWQITKESYGYKTFVATRVGEIQNKTDPEEWWWIESKNNAADLVTRVTQPSELGSNSMWQKGPDFLSQPISTWPIKKVIPSNDKDVDRIGIKISSEVNVVNVEPADLENMIKVSRYGKFETLLHVTILVKFIMKHRTFRNGITAINANSMIEAEEDWIKCIQRHLHKDWERRYRRLGPYYNSKGIIVVGKRMAEWLKMSWNQDFFILLPLKTDYTRLYVASVHQEDHAAIDVTIAKVRRKYWVPKLSNLVKSIKAKCTLCRLRDKKLMEQEMGSLPIDRFIPAPPFYNTTLDFFGPFWVKDTVKRRIKCKVFGILYSSSTEHSVYIDVSEGYDTDSYLIVQRRFFAMRGYPKKMRSDLGSQLVCANKEMKEILKNFDWRKISETGKDKGMEWEFSKSADAPWENGLSEALVKLVKRALPLAVGSNILTFAELQTVFFEIANLMNERPIGIKNNDPNDGTYLCPNDLLLGRSSGRVPPGIMDESCNINRRWVFVQQIANTFWRKWQRDYFHTLVIRQKWHVKNRSPCVGDVVLVQDTNAIRGTWRLAQVKEAAPGKDGQVRDVVLRLKNKEDISSYKGQPDMFIKRSIHRLVLILPVEEQKQC